MFGFVRAVNGHADVVSLGLRQAGEMYADALQMQAGHLFIQVFGQAVNADFVVMVEQLDLCQRLLVKELLITNEGWPWRNPG